MITKQLNSNGISLPYSEKYIGRLTDSDLADLKGDVARRRLAEDGYVLFRRALPRETVLDIREAYFKRFPADLVQNGDRRRGAFSGHMPPGLPKHGVAGHPAYDFVRGDIFNGFADHPTLRRIAEALLDGPVERIIRTPLRHFTKGQNVASRAHVDRTYIEGEPNDVLTLWVPLGDCPVEAGGLTYLEGSHYDVSLEEISRETAPNDRPHDRRPITHDLKWMSDVTKRRWLIADYEAGDVIAHTPGIVHASLDPDSDLIRLSTDIRFVKAGVPSDPRWRQHWSADDGY
jgi:hypothetical protein